MNVLSSFLLTVPSRSTISRIIGTATDQRTVSRQESVIASQFEL